MPKTVPMIGVHPDELYWMRLLISLLRHADPGVSELTRQALLYLAETSGKCGFESTDAPLSPPADEDLRCSGDNST